jgi:ATP-dependent exoDNAse (exonuclease V) alpha subunit
MPQLLRPVSGSRRGPAKFLDLALARRIQYRLKFDVERACSDVRLGASGRDIADWMETKAARNAGFDFAPGDKVMQIENDYDKEVYNGDVADVEPEEGELTASFDGRSVSYGIGELGALVPAEQMQSHKVLETLQIRREHPCLF